MNVEIDLGNITARITDALGQAMNDDELYEQIMRDVEDFVPYESGTLTGSVIRSYTKGSGELSWSTPYARRRYYENANIDRSIHVSATTHWAEEAASKYGADWALIIAKKAAKNL